jgi:hypothetical protein
MSVIIVSARVQDLADLEFRVRTAGVAPIIDRDEKWIYPSRSGVQPSYRQKCLDTVSGLWVSWTTLLYPDPGGQQYPGTGFDSTTYRITGVVHNRVQE